MTFHRPAIVFLCFLVGACGGDDEALLSSLDFDGKTLTASADIALDRSPLVIRDGDLPTCNNLIVPGRITAAPAPVQGGLTIPALTIYDRGQAIWSAPVVEGETRRDSDGTLFVIARGCPPADLPTDRELVVAFRVMYQGTSWLLASPPTKVLVTS